MNPSDITVEQGLAAYAKTGLIPRSGRVYDPDSNCGCLIGALCLAEYGEVSLEIENGYSSIATLRKLFGHVTKSGWALVNGFDCGWMYQGDSNPANLNSLPRGTYRVGFQIAQAMREFQIAQAMREAVNSNTDSQETK